MTTHVHGHRDAEPTAPQNAPHDLARRPVTAPEFEEAIRRHARYSLGRDLRGLSRSDLYRALALALRETILDGMFETEERLRRADAKHVYYLSIEFLLGRSLENNLANLGLLDTCRTALEAMGSDFDEVASSEPDAALGNGGLGRLAACFLDSLASMGYPATGYGINYDHGLFRQRVENGFQSERPDTWGVATSPWLIERPDEAFVIPVYGRVSHELDRDGNYNPMWLDWESIVGVPSDLPIVGYGGRTVNVLRLFSARNTDDIDLAAFNSGDFVEAVARKTSSETISKVLYPSDNTRQGRELRLIQEYFLVACAVRDIVRRFQRDHEDFGGFAGKVAIQLNDTHPALTVAELMRVLVDENDLPWDEAWSITRASLGYTNHTLLPEALETWDTALLERVLPRHLQIITEINRRFLEDVRTAFPGDEARIERMSIIDGRAERRVRMANLAIVGSHSVNGVSELHSRLVASQLVPDFYAMWPELFSNKTNGVTQRRWLLHANPGLSALLTETIGDGWIRDLEQLRNIEPLADDAEFQRRFMVIKRGNKERFGRVMADATRIGLDPDSLFDVQAKRFHEYKRQMLNVLHVIHVYLRLVDDRVEPVVPHTYLFAGKAAPGYWAAKQTIKLINNVANVIRRDPRARGRLDVAFVPDYRVSLAEKLIPAADVSEQISTAGMEASGTGNMKFAMNGAITIGTLDGANIEIREDVGPANMIIFGLRADEIRTLRERGSYDPGAFTGPGSRLGRVLEALDAGRFSENEPGIFRFVAEQFEKGDPYFLAADFDAYADAQESAERQYADSGLWARKAILNVARIGRFSSDRCIDEYAQDIWRINAV